MTWFKVDDSFWGHPKRVATSPAGTGLWVTAGSWCAQQLTDGHVPAHMLAMFGGRPRDAVELVRVGLWETREDGWAFHDWADWQPTRAQVQERRDAEAQRKQEWRDRKRAKQEGDAGVPPGQTADATRDTNGAGRGTDEVVLSTRPDPTRPDPTVVPNGTTKEPVPRKRGERLPEDWQPDPSLIAWQRAEGIPDSLARRELSVFRDYWAAKPGREGVKADWPATWRNWLRRAAQSVASRPVSVGSAALVPAIRTWTPPEDDAS